MKNSVRKSGRAHQTHKGSRMVLDKLGDSLKKTLSKVASSVFVDDRIVNELVKDIQRSLLQSDVNVALVSQIAKRIKERVKSEESPSLLTKKEHLVNIVYEELSDLLGKESSEIKIEKKFTKIMLLGLFGSGKTTTSGKLAKYFGKRGLKVAMIQLDVYRPAAYDQLVQLGKDLNVPVFGDKEEKDPLKIYHKYKDQLEKSDVAIIDTAGRDALSDDLIKELKELGEHIKPDESLLVISGDIGQAAKEQAEAFHQARTITGVIVTKLDGTSKGGGALTACSSTGANVKLIGVGEKPDDMEKYDSKKFVGRLLGMGDLETLLEKAQDAFSEEESRSLEKKLLKGEFDLIDLYEQTSSMKKLGPLTKIIDMVPGFGQLKLPKDVLEKQEVRLDKWKVAMDSMTEEELKHPDLMVAERIERVRKGSGLPAEEIQEMLREHKQTKKMMRKLRGVDSKSMEKMMRKMTNAKLKNK